MRHVLTFIFEETVWFSSFKRLNMHISGMGVSMNHIWSAGIKFLATPKSRQQQEVEQVYILVHIWRSCTPAEMFLSTGVPHSLCLGCIVSSSILVCPADELNRYAFVSVALNLLQAVKQDKASVQTCFLCFYNRAHLFLFACL